MTEELSTDKHNPFQAPDTPFEPMASADSEVEAIRRKHLSHEASVKSVGSLYLLGGLLGLFVLVMLLGTTMSGPGIGAVGLLTLMVMFTLIGVQLATAYGLNKLQPWARITSGVLSAIGLAGFPIGTLICGYILYLLFSAKGTMVFSEEYRRVIEQTPHIKYKTSIVMWIALFLVLGLFALVVLAVLLG
jgi:hypothetical protein